MTKPKKIKALRDFVPLHIEHMEKVKAGTMGTLQGDEYIFREGDKGIASVRSGFVLSNNNWGDMFEEVK